THAAHLAFAGRQQVDLAKTEALGADLGHLWRQFENRAPGHRFAGAGFAHNANLFATNGKTDTTNDIDVAVSTRKRHPKIVNFKQRFCHGSYPFLGSSTSRKPSPKRLKARLASRIAVPGTAASHHEVIMNSRPLESIAPHSGLGGCAPR